MRLALLLLGPEGVSSTNYPRVTIIRDGNGGTRTESIQGRMRSVTFGERTYLVQNSKGERSGLFACAPEAIAQLKPALGEKLFVEVPF